MLSEVTVVTDYVNTLSILIVIEIGLEMASAMLVPPTRSEKDLLGYTVNTNKFLFMGRELSAKHLVLFCVFYRVLDTVILT